MICSIKVGRCRGGGTWFCLLLVKKRDAIGVTLGLIELASGLEVVVSAVRELDMNCP